MRAYAECRLRLIILPHGRYGNRGRELRLELDAVHPHLFVGHLRPENCIQTHKLLVRALTLLVYDLNLLAYEALSCTPHLFVGHLRPKKLSLSI